MTTVTPINLYEAKGVDSEPYVLAVVAARHCNMLSLSTAPRMRTEEVLEEMLTRVILSSRLL